MQRCFQRLITWLIILKTCENEEHLTLTVNFNDRNWSCARSDNFGFRRCLSSRQIRTRKAGEGVQTVIIPETRILARKFLYYHAKVNTIRQNPYINTETGCEFSCRYNFQPFRRILSFMGCDQVNDYVCINIYHDCSIGFSFPESEIIYSLSGRHS